MKTPRHIPALFNTSWPVLRTCLTVVAVSAWLSGNAACTKKAVESEATDEDVPVSVQAAKIVDAFESTVNATGIVTPAPGAERTISAPDVAQIAELPKAEGERVTKGDLLVRFEIPTVTAELAARKADVAQANARLDKEKANRTRVAGLVAQGVMATKDLEEATASEAEANATVQQAEAALTAEDVLSNRMIVRAPFSGIVARRWHNVGDQVDASTSDPVIKIVDPSRLEVVASVTVADLSHVSDGKLARILNPVSNAVETAKIVSAPAAVDPANATAQVRLQFAKPTQLSPGTPVSVQIVTDQHAKVLVIPTVAILHDGNDIYVMVAGQDDDKAHKTAVTLGLASRELTEIKTGLKAGDLVIVRGQDGLPDDADITVVK